ncbi:MAG: ATP-binding cassette subfamily B protein [Kiritimatiellia bacterium]|jgi:ATP-binding cassette subfamily B protein
MSPPFPNESKIQNPRSLTAQFMGVFAYSHRAILLVWQTSTKFTLLLAFFTLCAGILPAFMAYIGQLIVDGVVLAAEQPSALVGSIGGSTDDAWLGVPSSLLILLCIEAVLVMGLMGTQRGISAVQSLFRGLLGHKVNVMVLEKARSLSLAQFEDSEFYDKLVRARREASTRPLALVNKTFGLLQNGIALSGFAVLLWQFSPLVIFLLLIAALPGFFAETFFSGKAFSLFRWRSPEAREQNYLETLLAREDNVKEMKLFGLNTLFLNRYMSIFNKLYKEDSRLTIRRDSWGLVMDIIAALTFYGAYAWIIVATVHGEISLGQMTMYLLVFKQGQSAITASLSSISGMYEDNLYLSNLYEYLEQPGEERSGGLMQGAIADDGIRFESVSFSYTGANHLALDKVSFHLRPGDSLAIVGENGSGKTTLIKLLTRLYVPSEGRILFDGTDVTQWDGEALRHHIGVIFQDFIRYQLMVGENIGVGQVDSLSAPGDQTERWVAAATQGQAAPFIDKLADQYNTQLGRWFKNGQELSGGQWQKMALSRAFMRQQAKVLILDEPTAAMDAQAEADIFGEFSATMKDKMTILISHRFSTVRTAKKIMVMDQGRVIETGSHEELIAVAGVYARLFNLQAQGYK